MKFAKKFLALCLTACLLCGLPLSLSVSAADTITLDKAVLLSTTDTTVTVQATFSAPIWLRPRRVSVISLRNSHAGGGCASSYSNQWTWDVSKNGDDYGVEYVDPIKKGNDSYASVINLTFPRCSCSDHTSLWGADGATIPNPIELCINDLWGTSGDGVIDSNNALGYNGELLAANYTVTDDALGKDFAYVAVEYKPITLESATLLSTDSDSVTVQANFSAPIYLQPGRLNSTNRGFVTLRNSHAGGGCASSYANQWTWEANANGVEYVNPTTSGSRQYASTINITFPRCECEDHTTLWGTNGNTMPASVELCIYDLWPSSSDADVPNAIDSENAYGIHGELLETTAGSSNMAYVAVTDNRTLQEKLNTGDGVTLTKNETVDGLIIPADKTLDLNGYTLTADQVISLGGFVVDSKDGVGGIVIAKNGTDDTHLLQLPANNAALPLYDEAFAGYRFFNCTLDHLQRAKGSDYQYGYILRMSDAAFALLVDNDEDGVIDADMNLHYNITVTIDEDEHVLTRKFASGILAEYGANQLLDDGNTYAAVFRITGFDKITTQIVTTSSTAPQVVSGTGVVISAAVETLTCDHSRVQ